MKRVILVALASLLVTSSALAVVVPDTGTDSFGVYFDVEGVLVNSAFLDTGFHDMFLVIAGLSAPSVAAWEVALDLNVPPTDAVIFSAGIVGDGVNFADLPQYIVGLGEPALPDEDGNVLLAVSTLFIVTPDVVIPIHGGPIDNPSIPGVPAYANGENVSELIPMVFSTDMNGQYLDDEGWTTIPIAVVNGEAPVATENATWSSVKGMYR